MDERQEIELSDTATAVARMGKDLRQAARLLGRRESRFLVDSYYLIQEQRIRCSNQARQIAKGGEPVGVLQWALDQFQTIEEQIKASLDVFSLASPVGEWMRSQKGIGPVLASGLLAHIDIERAPTAGRIWAFAGLSPTAVWNKGERRPWNAQLKKICFLVGESFVKVSGKRAGYYGLVYARRKALETAKNISGEYAEMAKASLVTTNYAKNTDAYRWCSGTWMQEERFCKAAIELGVSAGQISAWREKGEVWPMLAPARIHARARRYAVKLFLSHLHEVWYFSHYGRLPPLPFPLEHLPGHTHLIGVPNGEMIEGYIEARARFSGAKNGYHPMGASQ